MQYLGGKHTLAKKIAAYLESVRPKDAPFFDVCTGSANVVAAMTGERVANDACAPLITLYRAWLSGWRPPAVIDEDEYAWIQAANDPASPLTAFAGFGLSFGGKFFAGYARNRRGDDFLGAAVRGLDRKMAACRDVDFFPFDFEDLIIPDGALVYLDPPYRGTTAYGFFSVFDHDRFERWALALSRRCVVVLSEYAASKPWVEVAAFEPAKGRLQIQPEKLFMVRA